MILIEKSLVFKKIKLNKINKVQTSIKNKK